MNQKEDVESLKNLVVVEIELQKVKYKIE